MRQKASDYSCIPLCVHCHRTAPGAYHGINTSAREFEQRHDLNFRELVKRLNHLWFAHAAEVK